MVNLSNFIRDLTCKDWYGKSVYLVREWRQSINLSVHATYEKAQEEIDRLAEGGYNRALAWNTGPTAPLKEWKAIYNITEFKVK